MKKLLILLLVYSPATQAQISTAKIKTSLNSFIENNAVQWAAYSNDTSSFAGSGVMEQLFNQYKAGKIKGVIPVDNGSADEDHFQNRSEKDLEKLLFGSADTMYNSEKTGIKTTTPARFSDLLKDPVYELSRIFYVRDGALRSYISRVSAKTPVTTGSGLYIGLLKTVSFGVNKKYNAAPAANDKQVRLGEIDKTFYSDSIGWNEQLKEVYGRNLIETLWPSVVSGKASLYTNPGNQKITASQLRTGNYPGADKIHVPVYDSLGNLSPGAKVMTAEISASSFDKILIREDIYYDETKDIFIGKINEILLFRQAFGTDEVSKPAFRLVF